MVDAFASREHYVDHLAPIWAALPPEHRGTFITSGGAAARAEHLGIPTTNYLLTSARLTLVASEADYATAHNVHTRPIAYVNHGVGQAWRAPDRTLIPTGVGKPRPGARVFLTPGPHATSVTREANPHALITEVGSPRVEELRSAPAPTEPLLVVSGHWDMRATLESRSALPYYLPALRDRLPMRVALHAHPRLRFWAEPQAAALGIEFIPTFTEVCRRATVYATDSSSTLFEFAALDRPVIVLNHPTYRREHSHGLRFWDAANVGVNVNHPHELPDAVVKAVLDHPPQRAARRKALALAYHPFDGRAADRAVRALLAHS